jgi:alpha-tubulin suppressor-like RCC1 family protein
MDEMKKMKKRNAAVAIFVAAIMVASVMMFVFSDDADDDAGLGFFDDTPLGAPVATPAVAAGNQHSLYLRSDGTVWAWGYNEYGQLGDGTNGTGTHKSAPVQVKGVGGSGFLTGITAIAAGGNNSLALDSNGDVFSWGYNGENQLGDGTNVSRSTPVHVLGWGGAGELTGVTAISVGFNHSLALKSNGEVYAWGYNGNGQLGFTSLTQSPHPMHVSGGTSGTTNLNDVIAISAGSDHSLALKSNGDVYAWGRNVDGQLGIGTSGAGTNKNTPEKVLGGTSGTANLTGVTAIAGGSNHSLALKSDGTLWAWGWNNVGQLGNGTTTEHNTPVQVQGGLSDIKAISAGINFSLVLKNDGMVWAWGANGSGQLGNGTTGAGANSTPAQVKGAGGTGNMTNVTEISAGGSKVLAVKGDGTAWAWGAHAYGQLGDGTNMPSSTPVQVKLPSSGGGGMSMTVIAVVAVAAVAAIGAAVWFFFLRK